MLSLLAESWENALASGAETEKTAHWPYVGEDAAGPDGGGLFTTDW